MPINTERGSLSVIGTGLVQTKADLALLTVGVTTESKSVKEAQDQNSEISKNLLRSLSDYGVPKENIYTENLSIIRNYDYTNNVLISYKVTNTITIIVNDFSKLNDIYSLAVENGANDNINLNFTLSNPKYFYNQALKQASQDALNKANLLSKSFGVKYNPIPCKIHENSSSLYSITYASPATYTSSPAIPSGLVKITAEIEVVFATYPF